MGTSTGQGVLVVANQQGKQLGVISYKDRFLTNVMVGGDDYVYMTALQSLLRIKCTSCSW